MRKTTCDKLFNKSYKKFIKSIPNFSKKLVYENWLFEILTSFLWLKKYNGSEFFDFKKETTFLIDFVFDKKQTSFNHSENVLKTFYNLCTEFYKFNSNYLKDSTLKNILIRNDVLKNIIIFVKNNFNENIDFISNKFIKKT